jgi:glycerophosphoryl diester phosphodiesterase
MLLAGLYGNQRFVRQLPPAQLDHGAAIAPIPCSYTRRAARSAVCCTIAKLQQTKAVGSILSRMTRSPIRPTIRQGEPLPWIIAHRGHSAEAPENTASAFDAALQAPIDGIETDVQMSADGVPMIHHDATVVKLGGGRRRVSALPWRELRALDAGGRKSERFRGERLLSLAELLDGWGGRTWLLLEIKARPGDRDPAWHRRLTERTIDEVRRRRLESSVLLLCFDQNVLAAARRYNPRIRTVRNLDRLPIRESRMRDVLTPLFAASVNVRALHAKFVDLAHQMGKPVLTYTCNDRRTARRALAAGADAIMANDPGQLARLVHEGGTSE